ncbi:hypothetical protein FOZ62_012096, partial [Perkinsus olseni]
VKASPASIRNVTSPSKAKCASSSTGSREKLELMRRRIPPFESTRAPSAAEATDELTRRNNRLQAELEKGRRSRREAMEASYRRSALENSQRAVRERTELTDMKQENYRLQAQVKVLEEHQARAVEERGRGHLKGAARQDEDISQ